VAAHWMYKEGAKSSQAGYEAKIAWLRQVMDWQKEMADYDDAEREAYQHIFSDRIYVFTPNGDVIDLPKTATPLDFAYSIHTDIGHRCKGAKVNDVMVPLTYHLKMGDKIEILTGKEPNPSRDWLSPQRGYLNTPRARAKLHHWFRVKEFDQNAEAGESIFERECRKAGLKHTLTHTVIEKLNFKTKEDLLAALGHGDIRIGAVMSAMQAEINLAEGIDTIAQPRRRAVKVKALRSDFEIAGVTNLLTHVAKCCKPVPGDEIVGYVTLGQGVSIHRADCINITNKSEYNQDRLIEVNWGNAEDQQYSADLNIIAQHKSTFVRELTNQLSQEKVPVLALQSQINKADQLIHLRLTIEVGAGKTLNKVIHLIQQMSGVIEVKRG
ncbi:MAG: TGS domain-containing protein, partial [Pseudomonadota bacterium]|nr:TGS domain-containing protein [Pseudomonadota bacterium]